MSRQSVPTDLHLAHSRVANPCPQWCAIRHGSHAGEDDLVHVSAALLVERTVLRLAASIDPDTGTQDGPVVLVGEEEFTLYEAEALIGALTNLVNQGTQAIARDTEERPKGGCSGGK